MASTKRASAFKGVKGSDRLWRLDEIVEGLQHEDVCVVAEAFVHFGVRGLSADNGNPELYSSAVAIGVIPLLLNMIASSPGCTGTWAAIKLQDFDGFGNHEEITRASTGGVEVLTRALQLVADHPALLELPEVVESTLMTCVMIKRLHRSKAAFVVAGALAPIVALLLCPERSRLLPDERRDPLCEAPSWLPLELLQHFLAAPGGAAAAVAAGAIPKLVALLGVDDVHLNLTAAQCLSALSARFGAEVAAAKAGKGQAKGPPPPAAQGTAASAHAAAAALAGPGDDLGRVMQALRI